MSRCLRVLLCLPLLATTACVADAIAGPELWPGPEANAAAQAESVPAGVQEPATVPRPPRLVLRRSDQRISSSALGTAPVFIVDGAPWTGWPDTLPASEIESIEVATGATLSAIYGSRGITALVIIRTRDGVGLRAAALPVAAGDAGH